MMKRLFYILFFIGLSVAFASVPSTGSAQYYVTGTDPASLKWNQIKNKNNRLIFPDYYLPKARVLSCYMDTVTPYISYGLMPKIDKFPIVLHPTNLYSNGLVTWAPKRMELYPMPAVESYAMPWLKQLAVHEYRHVVQMSNLNVGITRVASYILGEQIVGVVALIPPGWFFEGDAVMAETQFSMFGRGWQPSFSIEYRAMVNEDADYFNLDKWVCGSYKDFYPNEYQLGYQVVAGARRYYGDDFWGKVLRYCGRNPYFIVSANLAYRKYGNTGTKEMMQRTFADLKEYWHAASSVPNSSVFIETPHPSYSIYRYPGFLNDTVLIAAKKDMDYTEHFVSVNRITGEEQKLRYTGTFSSRPVIDGNRMLWTEYRPSLFWEQKNSSVIRSAGIVLTGKGYRMSRPKTISGRENIYFVTPMGEAGYVMMISDRLNNPSIRFTDTLFHILKEYPLAGGDISLHGLAWDDKTGTVAFIALDDEGMWIGAIDSENGKITKLTMPSLITVSDLSAGGGKLYFSSIQSGKDEVHLFDLEQKKEYRISASKYGSVSPAGVRDSVAVFATYRRDGYLLAQQKFDTGSLIAVEPKKLPENILNPDTVGWGLLKLDTVNVSEREVQERYPVKKYRKAGHLFNVHSWMPFAIDLPELLDERSLEIGVGITGISQNVLNSMVSTLGYGWVPSTKSHLLLANFTYTGLPVHVSMDLEYGGGKQELYLPYDKFEEIKEGGLKNYLKVGGTLSLPMNFSGGNNSRSLQPYVSLEYYNALLYNSDNLSGADKGMEKLSGGVVWSNNRYMTQKDYNPPFGYYIQLSTSHNPFNERFGHLYSIYARGYLPGIAAHHSVTLQGNVQYQKLGNYNFKQKLLYPRGCNYDFAPQYLYAAALNYKFPIAYPDGGIPNVLYIKRIGIDLFGEYAHSEFFSGKSKEIRNPYTYGGEVNMDLQIFRIGVNFNIGLSLYKPSERNGLSVGFNLGFAL